MISQRVIADAGDECPAVVLPAERVAAVVQTDVELTQGA